MAQVPRRRRILLVEDDESVRLMLAELLVREGYQVFQARDALQATAMLGEADPDLVLTDYTMPHMNGEELARRIRCNGKPSVVLITGKPDGLSRAHSADNPFDGVLAKPFPLPSLLAMIHRCIAA